MVPRPLSLLGAVALCACGQPTPIGEAIIGGEPAADEAAVAIRPRRSRCEDAPTDAACSGLLIAPRVVMTAAHCVERVRSRGALEVVFGARVQGGVFVVVDVAYAHPDYVPGSATDDIAVLMLAEDAPVAPVELGSASVADLLPGASLRAIGFGVTERRADDSGERRSGALALATVSPTTFTASASPGMTCTGDSGGPVLATVAGREEVIGVTSRGDFACAEDAEQTRVDVVRDELLVPAIAMADTLPPGWPADAIPLDRVATEACAADEECPASFTCADAIDGPRCVLPMIGEGVIGPACETDAQCGEGSCARIWPDGPDACRCFSPPPATPPAASCSAIPGRSGGPWMLVVSLLAVLRALVR